MQNKKELIEAMTAGDVQRIKTLKEQNDECKKGKMLWARLNEDDTWHALIIGMQEINGHWVESDRYKRLSAEDFAALIVKYDYEVMAEWFCVNYKFPEHSDVYEPPDPNVTPEQKYDNILKELKNATVEIRRMIQNPEEVNH
jgi:hypothetical protein